MSKTVEVLRSEWNAANATVAAGQAEWEVRAAARAAEVELMDAATRLAEKAERTAWEAYRSALAKEKEKQP